MPPSLMEMPTPAPVPPALAALLDRVTRGRGDKLLRFGMVSVVGVLITQVVLILGHGVVGLGALLANLVAVTVAAVPVFFLNKRWVWGQDGRPSMRHEVLPFWGFTLLGLLASTVMVAIASALSDSTVLLMAANIAGFGVVWVSKFLFLDAVVFARVEARAAAAPVGVDG